MKQPKININGTIYKVASIWWDVEDGTIIHCVYHVNGTVETVFGDYITENLIIDDTK